MNALRNHWMKLVLFLLCITLWVDVSQWHAKNLQQAAEQLYLHTYPARKLYTRYIQPWLGEDARYPMNRLRMLNEPAGILQQSRSAVYAVALLDMRAGDLRMEFPEGELFSDASFSVVGWDGLIALGGQAQGHHTIAAGDFTSLFLFVRLVQDPDDVDSNAMQTALDAVRIGHDDASDKDFSTVHCQPASLPRDWLPCTDSLLPVIDASGAFAATYAQYRDHAGLDTDTPAMADRLVLAASEADKSLVMALRHSVGYLNANRWWVYRDFFRLDPAMVDPLLMRAAFWAAPFLPVPDSKIKVALNNDDDTGQYLTGGEHVYKLVFDTTLLSPETVDWSFSVYALDSPLVWVAGKPAVLRKKHAVLAGDGTVTLYFSQSCPAGIAQENWLPIPAGHFMVVYRAHTRLPLDRYDDFPALSRLEKLAPAE